MIFQTIIRVQSSFKFGALFDFIFRKTTGLCCVLLLIFEKINTKIRSKRIKKGYTTPKGEKSKENKEKKSKEKYNNKACTEKSSKISDPGFKADVLLPLDPIYDLFEVLLKKIRQV